LNPVPKHIFITGGSHFYAEAIKHPQCTHLFITEIVSDSEWEYDTFFPEYKHLTEYKPLNITNSSIDWLLKVDPQFPNLFKSLKQNKEEGYIIESESIKYKFMLYSKA
jgi:dihydrofolate reductase